MLQKLHLKNILFLDIETVPQQESFDQLDAENQVLYEKKTAYQRKSEEIEAADFYDRAGIWAEFGKIICISVGFFTPDDQFRIRSFYGEEPAILTGFKKLLDDYFNKPEHLLCAHNGKEFDFPYIARRMVIHGMPLPEKLQLFGKKPWEVPHLDTLELWKFGDYKHFTSLQLLTNILGIASPKDDIDGSMVAEVYYKENDVERIVSYCERDTLAVAQVLLKFINKPLLKEKQIIFVKE